MKDSDLHKVADNLFNCLLLIRHNIFDAHEFIRSIPKFNKNKVHSCMDFPLAPSHIKVILYLKKVKCAQVSQIANSLNISKSNMTPIIDKLIEFNLVSRYSDETDRRIIRVELTKKAYGIFDAFNNNAKNLVCENLSKISDDDIKILNESLTNISRIFSKI